MSQVGNDRYSCCDDDQSSIVHVSSHSLVKKNDTVNGDKIRIANLPENSATAASERDKEKSLEEKTASHDVNRRSSTKEYRNDPLLSNMPPVSTTQDLLSLDETRVSPLKKRAMMEEVASQIPTESQHARKRHKVREDADNQSGDDDANATPSKVSVLAGENSARPEIKDGGSRPVSSKATSSSPPKRIEQVSETEELVHCVVGVKNRVTSNNLTARARALFVENQALKQTNTELRAGVQDLNQRLRWTLTALTKHLTAQQEPSHY